MRRDRPDTGFLPESLIIEAIRGGNNYDPAEDLAHAGGFVLFDGRGMRTWLVATRLRLYCVADERRASGPRILWSISRSRLFGGGKGAVGQSLSIEVRPCNERGAKRVDIGYRKGCPYSPGLFRDTGVGERVRALLREKMGAGRDGPTLPQSTPTSR